MHGEEMSKLDETDTEMNVADREFNGASFLSDVDEALEDDDSIDGDMDSDETTANSHKNPKELRDIAEGKNLNNSFLGSSYPENWDHLHFDKGPNPQFEYLDTKSSSGHSTTNNIFELAG